MNRSKEKKETEKLGTPTKEVWYLARHKLLMVQGPGVKPSSIRFFPGQRFTLDGDEPVDIESLLRTGAVKIYEESDVYLVEDLNGKIFQHVGGMYRIIADES